MSNKTLGSILNKKGFTGLLETINTLSEKEIKGFMQTSEDSPISEIDQLLFFVPDFFYKKDEEGNSTTQVQDKAYDFIRWAFEHEANPNSTIKYGNSCFLKAAQHPTKELMQFLIDNYPAINIKQQDGKGMDAIMHSVAGNSHEVFDMLTTSSDFDVNKKYIFLHNKTLLHTACTYGHEEMIDKLLSMGADLNAMDDYDIKPFEMVPTPEDCDFLSPSEMTEEVIDKWEKLFARLELQSIEKTPPVAKKTFKTSF